MMEAVNSSANIYHRKRQYVPEDIHLQTRRPENLRFHQTKITFLYTSVSQTGFPGTLRFGKGFSGVP
jgi:hypothetical protein